MKIKRLKINELLKIIKQGGIIVSPTDTVYGLLADATNEKAVKKIFKIKKRSKEKPIPLFVKDVKMAKRFSYINKKQENLLKLFWPGKATMILKRKNTLPRIIFGNKKTIGLRIPNFKLINSLLKRLDRPLTGTSANISGKPASTEIRELLKQFKNVKEKPDLILNYGNLKFSLPSVIIDLTGKRIRILRV